MKDFFSFLMSKAFLKQLLYVTLFLMLALFLVLMWLRVYTNHGQKIALPDYLGKKISEATKDAESKTFELIITDSIHRVGMQGGVIIDQNPNAGSKVKENRKIYVNVTKYDADKIKVKDLPILYGNDFDQKSIELKYQEINTEIKSSKHDLGEPNHILEVWYNDKLIIDRNSIKNNVEIDKGGTLQFVISKQEGGSDVIPNLVCETFNAAEFKALSAKFKIGYVKEHGIIKDRNTAFILSQSPTHDGHSKLAHNSSISVVIVQQRPGDCK